MSRSHNEPARDARSHSGERDCAELSLTMWRHVSPHESLPIHARFGYDRTEPLEVRVAFLNDVGGAVTWVLSRELLMAGLHRPSGDGDVRIWPPCPRHGGDSLWLLLRGRTGAALLEGGVAPLRAWLGETLRAVPFGAEGLAMDWDEVIAHVLAPGDR
ncbi:SsgA family sporulation/cell division regulator [Streptomyces sp. NPDC050508]|uniref:SsgA family sporulation/cell division regulator n=1 Tax=Streptomyces sp. NPDC050508 TaxID=3155405 RepID=UPI00343F7005